MTQKTSNTQKEHLLQSQQQAALARIIDEQMDWLLAWLKIAVHATTPRKAEQLPQPPQSFSAWFRQVSQNQKADQAAIDKMAVLHDQLHTLARIVALKAPEGAPPAAKDFDAVLEKFSELIRALRRYERAFNVAASGLDPLTGLRTRTGLMEELARELQRFERNQQVFCIAILDLDRFKLINDTHGHDMGDRVLAAAAACIGKQLRGMDEAYRLGGEEFLLLLKQTPLTEARKAVERIRLALMENRLTLPNGQTLAFTASFGLTDCANHKDVDALLKAADTALYRAKQTGRNRIIVAE